MKNKLIGKLRSKSGETIGETLIALLISALALTMLASAISHTQNTINVSDKSLEKYYLGENDLVMRKADSELIQSGTLTVNVGAFTMNEDGSVQADYWYNEQLPSNKVIAYTYQKKPLSE